MNRITRTTSSRQSTNPALDKAVRRRRRPIVLVDEGLELPSSVHAVFVRMRIPILRARTLYELGQIMFEYESDIECIILMSGMSANRPSWLAGLMAFRKQSPNVPVVLVAEDLPSDDFTTRQLSIADVSLRFPVAVDAVLRGVIQARENNVMWVDRSMQAKRRTTA